MATVQHVGVPDKTFRLGRCNTCRRRPAFAWKAGTLKLGEARCSICNRILSQTTREVATGFRIISAEDALPMLKDACDRLYARKLESLAMAGRWRDEGNEIGARMSEESAAKLGREFEDARRRLHKLHAEVSV